MVPCINSACCPPHTAPRKHRYKKLSKSSSLDTPTPSSDPEQHPLLVTTVSGDSGVMPPEDEISPHLPLSTITEEVGGESIQRKAGRTDDSRSRSQSPCSVSPASDSGISGHSVSVKNRGKLGRQLAMEPGSKELHEGLSQTQESKC